MTRIGISCFNYEHGGLPVTGRGGAAEGYEHSGIAAAGYHGGGYGYDYAGLVRVMADGTPWPDIFILGFSDRRLLHHEPELRIRVADMSGRLADSSTACAAWSQSDRLPLHRTRAISAGLQVSCG
jgi:hypothetical protein